MLRRKSPEILSLNTRDGPQRSEYCSLMREPRQFTDRRRAYCTYTNTLTHTALPTGELYHSEDEPRRDLCAFTEVSSDSLKELKIDRITQIRLSGAFRLGRFGLIKMESGEIAFFGPIQKYDIWPYMSM